MSTQYNLFIIKIKKIYHSKNFVKKLHNEKRKKKKPKIWMIFLNSTIFLIPIKCDLFFS